MFYLVTKLQTMFPYLKHLLPLMLCFTQAYAQQYITVTGLAKIVKKNSYSTSQLAITLKYTDDGCCFNDIDGKNICLKLTDHHSEAVGFGRGYWDVYESANTLIADYKQYTIKINKEQWSDAFIIEDKKQGIIYTVEKASKQ